MLKLYKGYEYLIKWNPNCKDKLREDPARFMDYLVRHLPGDLVESDRSK